MVVGGRVPEVDYKGQPHEPGQKIDEYELVARVLAHVPDPKRHVVHYCGTYSNVARGKRKKARAVLQAEDEVEASEDLKAMVVDAPDTQIKVHTVKLGRGEFTAVIGVMEGQTGLTSGASALC